MHAVLDELAAQDVVGISLRDELLELERARARLDAEVARRLLAFDQSHDWSVDGSKSAAAYLVKHTRCASGEPTTECAWRARLVNSMRLPTRGRAAP